MSEENKAVVRRFYDEVMGRGNLDVLDELIAEDFNDHGEALFGSPQGRNALREAIIGGHNIFTDFNVYIEDMITDGDMVGVRGTMRCYHHGQFMSAAPTGNQLSWKGLVMWRVVDGKAVERWFNSDSLSILQQLNLVPVNL
ncbi:MAG: ester cyclase [Egibacteraceae bacterium]